jgi:hypothetical protein
VFAHTCLPALTHWVASVKRCCHCVFCVAARSMVSGGFPSRSPVAVGRGSGGGGVPAVGTSAGGSGGRAGAITGTEGDRRGGGGGGDTSLASPTSPNNWRNTRMPGRRFSIDLSAALHRSLSMEDSLVRHYPRLLSPPSTQDPGTWGTRGEGGGAAVEGRVGGRDSVASRDAGRTRAESPSGIKTAAGAGGTCTCALGVGVGVR